MKRHGKPAGLTARTSIPHHKEMTMKTKKTLHVYFDENETNRWDTFQEGLRKVGHIKARSGDVTTVILLTAMEDDDFIRRVKENMVKMGE